MTETVAAHPLTYALGYALVRFLWQGAVIGLVAAALLALTRRASASSRYLMATASFFIMAALPAVTVARTFAWNAAMRGADPHELALLRADFVDNAPAVGSNPFDLFSAISATLWSPGIVIAWSAGVLVLVTRLLLGWRTVARLRAGAHAVDDNDWLARTTARLAAALGVRRSVSVVRSVLVDVPAVVGWLRPVIVMPMSAVAGLTPSQLDAIIAHELAHIRRHDHLVNALQTIVETLLFYHPSVWWLSRQMRVEREHCCDDAALALGATPTDYARALTMLEEARFPRGLLAVSAADGSLVSRIRRVLGHRPQPVSRPRVAVLIGLAIAAVSAAVGATAAGSARPDSPPVVVATQTYPPPPPSAGSSSAVPQSAAGEAQIVALEETYRRARLANDTTTLERLLDAAFVGGFSADSAINRAQWVGRQSARMTSLVINTRQIRIEDGAALVRGIETLTTAGRAVQHWYIRAWKLGAGGWTLVSHIQTLVPSAARGARAGTPPPPPPPPPAGVRTMSESITITGGNQTTLRVGGDVRPPVKIKDVKPVYPAVAKAAGTQGIVFIEVVVDPQGNVTSPHVLRSTGSSDLDQAALDAVTQWRYTPTLLNGQPVSVAMTITVNFMLGN